MRDIDVCKPSVLKESKQHIFIFSIKHATHAKWRTRKRNNFTKNIWKNPAHLNIIRIKNSVFIKFWSYLTYMHVYFYTTKASDQLKFRLIFTAICKQRHDIGF